MTYIPQGADLGLIFFCVGVCAASTAFVAHLLSKGGWRPIYETGGEGDGLDGRGTLKTNAFCSFCRKSYRDVGPFVEGPGEVYICSNCVELCQSILAQEAMRRAGSG